VTGFNGSNLATPTLEGELIGSEYVAIHDIYRRLQSVRDSVARFAGGALRQHGEFVTADAGNDVRFANVIFRTSADATTARPLAHGRSDR